jgi:hypothetical protein
MFMAIRRYEGCPDARELDRRIRVAVMPLVRVVPGMLSYSVVDFGAGAVATVSIYDSRDHAEAATAEVAALVRAHLADLLPEPPAVAIGEVVASYEA